MKVPTYTMNSDIPYDEGIDPSYCRDNENSLNKKLIQSNPSLHKQKLIEQFLSENLFKFTIVGEIAKLCIEREINSVCSFGSGSCINEYYLYNILNRNIRVIATDCNKEDIKTAELIFPEIVAKIFDFKTGSVEELFHTVGMVPDLVIFINSSYVLDDTEFITLFSRISQSGVKMVLDFTTACRPAHVIARKILFQKIRLFLFDRRSKGLMHGYERDWMHLKKLYHNSGFTIVTDKKVGVYPHCVQLIPDRD